MKIIKDILPAAGCYVDYSKDNKDEFIVFTFGLNVCIICICDEN